MTLLNRAALPYVQARWFTPGTTDKRAIDLVVLHTAEAPDKGDTAEKIAAYFAAGSEGRKASAHYVADSDSIVHCVQEKDVAYGAPQANRRGVHIEHAGFAAQTAADWRSSYNVAMLALSASLSASLCASYHIPPVFLHAADLLAGRRGITTHRECSRAWLPSGHTDPGPNFPVADYVAHVVNLLHAEGIRQLGGRVF